MKIVITLPRKATKLYKTYNGGYATFKDGLIVYDKDVAAFAKKHLRFIDKFDTRKVVEAGLESFVMLSGAEDIPEGKWYF